MKNVYISGPMTGIKNLNREAFEKAERLLRESGHFPINPHRFPQLETYEECIQMDLEVIAMSAEAIALLPGWETSPGSKKELKIALDLGLEIMLLKEVQYETL